MDKVDGRMSARNCVVRSGAADVPPNLLPIKRRVLPFAVGWLKGLQRYLGQAPNNVGRRFRPGFSRRVLNVV